MGVTIDELEKSLQEKYKADIDRIEKDVDNFLRKEYTNKGKTYYFSLSSPDGKILSENLPFKMLIERFKDWQIELTWTILDMSYYLSIKAR